MREIVSPRREEQDSCLIFGQSKCVLTKRDCISNNDLIKRGICNFFYGVAGENPGCVAYASTLLAPRALSASAA